MSSTDSEATCPRCKKVANETQDNITCEVNILCSHCGYSENNSPEAPLNYNKITTGFVIQEYETKEDGTKVCIGQTFVASDEVSREDTRS